jgi:hypothetical protein
MAVEPINNEVSDQELLEADLPRDWLGSGRAKEAVIAKDRFGS